METKEQSSEKKEREETKNANGRPRLFFDKTLFEKLVAVGCTDQEISAVLGISKETIIRNCQKEYDLTLAEYIAQNRKMKRRAELRNKLWDSNAPAVMIFMAKNELGYSENPVAENKQEDLMKELVAIVKKKREEIAAEKNAQGFDLSNTQKA